MHVRFTFTEPSEAEFFEEYDRYIGLNMWFVLIFIMRLLASVPFFQAGIFAAPTAVQDFFNYVSVNSSLFYVSNCKAHEEYVKNCNEEMFIFEMGLCGLFSFSLGLIAAPLSDLYGRRIISLLTSIVWFVTSIIFIFLTNRSAITICYLAMHTCSSSISFVMFVNFAEITTKNIRMLSIYILPSSAMAFLLYSHSISWLRDWQYLLMFNVSTIPLTIFACWYIPESPMWLLNKHKNKEFNAQLREISGMMYDITLEENRKSVSKKRVCYSMMRYLFRKKLKHFLLLMMMTASSTAFYIGGKWQAGSAFVTYKQSELITALAELFSFGFTLFLYFVLGKHYGLLLLYVLMTLSSLIILATFDQYTMFYYSIFSLALGLPSLLLTWLYILDVFPTFIRVTIMGCSFFVFGLIGVCSVFFADYHDMHSDFYYYLTFTIMGTLGLMVWCLPEIPVKDLPNLKLNVE